MQSRFYQLTIEQAEKIAEAGMNKDIIENAVRVICDNLDAEYHQSQYPRTIQKLYR
jgi:hypothetical protein